MEHGVANPSELVDSKKLWKLRVTVSLDELLIVRLKQYWATNTARGNVYDRQSQTPNSAAYNDLPILMP